MSRDTPESHARFREKNNLPFPLLSDVDGTVCAKYGVLKEKNMYGKKQIGIERTTFLIDQEGRVEKIFPRVKVEGHCGEVIEAL